MTTTVHAASSRPFTPVEKLRLALEIVRLYARARRVLRRSGLPATLADLRSAPGRVDALGLDGERLGRAVARTLARIPSRSRCLMHSLVLTALLSRRGLESTFVIGVSSEGGFGAHAWVERAGVPLLPTHEPTFGRLAEL